MPLNVSPIILVTYLRGASINFFIAVEPGFVGPITPGVASWSPSLPLLPVGRFLYERGIVMGVHHLLTPLFSVRAEPCVIHCLQRERPRRRSHFGRPRRPRAASPMGIGWQSKRRRAASGRSPDSTPASMRAWWWG